MKVILYGTIFKRNGEAAVKLSYTGEGKAVAKFTVSEPRKFGRSEGNNMDFWDFTVFGKQAEFLEKNFPGGKPIAIIGDAYHSKDDKGKTYLNLVASEVDFLPKEYGPLEAQVQSPETKAINQAQQTAPPQNQAPVQQQPVTQQTQQSQPVQQAVQQTAPQAQPVAQPAQQPASQPVAQPQFQQTPPSDFDPFA